MVLMRLLILVSKNITHFLNTATLVIISNCKFIFYARGIYF